MWSVRARARLVYVGIGVCAGAVIATPSEYAWIPVVGSVLVIGAAATRLRCPRCGESAYRRRVVVLGQEWYDHALVPRYCSSCGMDFRRPPRPGELPIAALAGHRSNWTTARSAVALSLNGLARIIHEPV